VLLLIIGMTKRQRRPSRFATLGCAVEAMNKLNEEQRATGSASALHPGRVPPDSIGHCCLIVVKAVKLALLVAGIAGVSLCTATHDKATERDL
jgi:hypothetical protein